MSDDIATRLRHYADVTDLRGEPVPLAEAADEIERLEAENGLHNTAIWLLEEKVEKLEAEGGWGTVKRCDTCCHWNLADSKSWGSMCREMEFYVGGDFFCSTWTPKDGE